jgi:hypothetical protein
MFSASPHPTFSLCKAMEFFLPIVLLLHVVWGRFSASLPFQCFVIAMLATQLNYILIMFFFSFISSMYLNGERCYASLCFPLLCLLQNFQHCYNSMIW